MTRSLWLGLAFLGACDGHAPALPPCGVLEEYDLRTDDGAAIHLHRHAADGPPVVVVHGISSNHYCWDLDAERSLGTYLAANGFDAWLLDLRGHGDARYDAQKRLMLGDWSLDDYALHDLPTAIGFVLDQTNSEKLAYVGHSLGGMIAAIYASQLGDERLSALVAVGSPVDFRDPDPVLLLSSRTFAMSGNVLPLVYTPPMARLLDLTGRHIQWTPEDFLYNPENMERGAASRMMETVVSPLWGGEMRHFAALLRAERFQSFDGDTDYTAAMASIQVPTLVVAGRADRVAPPDRVKAYFDWVGSPARRYVLAGKENGFEQDYGHLDLALGDRAREEIYPLILVWLRDHAQAGEGGPNGTEPAPLEPGAVQ